MKTPFDLLARLAPKLTPEEEAEASRLGVTPAAYQAAKLEVLAEEARRQLPPDDRPADIVREERIAQRLRREPGLFKPRNERPNVFVEAAQAPGEVARTILFVLLYLAGLIGLIVFGGEKFTRMPGIFQCIVLGVMILPVMWLTGRVWEGIGERARDGLRLLVRLWPLTLVAALFALGLLKLALGK